MTRLCAWCKQTMGQRPPLEDKQPTHGICPACSQAMLRAAGVSGSPIERLAKPDPSPWFSTPCPGSP
jgi:hypothetical protein